MSVPTVPVTGTLPGLTLCQDINIALAAVYGLTYAGGEVGINTATTLTAANGGGLYVPYGGSAFNITLPVASSCANGKPLAFKNIATVGIPLVCQGSDTIRLNGTTSVATFTLLPGESLVINGGSSPFDAVAGTALIPYASTFASPTFTGTATAANLTVSGNETVGGTLGVTGALTSTPLAGTGTRAVVATAAGVLTAQSAPPFTKVNVQKFTASGTYTPSSGMMFATIECVGGGGGGGATTAPATSANSAGGGGGGAYARKTATAATIGSSQAVTIGAGGAGGGAGPAAGTAGGTTSVGSLCVAAGGSGGNYSSGLSVGAGGLGGSSTTGDFGSWGVCGGTSCSFNGGVQQIAGAMGGSSIFSSGALAAIIGSGSAVTGNTGVGYGGGGGGGVAFNYSGTANGGSGSAGIVIITEYCSQ